MRAVCVSLVVIAALALSAAAGTIHVPGDQPSITYALAFAVSGDTVLVAADTYYESGLGLHGGVTLRGATGDPADVVIDCGGLGRVLYCEEMEAGTRLEAVTVTGGYISDAAGLRIGHAAVDLADCVFAGNVADTYGAGAYLPYEDSQASFTRCVFENNEAGTGGAGVFAWSAAGVTFTDCTFVGNSAGLYGGGVYCYDMDCVFTGCTFVANEAVLYGAGIYLENCAATLERCLIVDSTDGGAMTVYSSAGLTIGCCDFWNNLSNGAAADWVAPFAGELGVNGNISADPEFCGVDGSGNYYLQSDSPCAPAVSGCVLPIGAWPVGCDETAAAARTWTAVKELY
ncbi:MAG: right-handed parallel beta-helix repeat-containing protein [Candidatus Krumholzibacteriota bacterium]|nr:right-handed parallel beta-helix repeat-containing protein [Candidatus Krumholzibacteriota bacterium]